MKPLTAKQRLKAAKEWAHYDAQNRHRSCKNRLWLLSANTTRKEALSALWDGEILVRVTLTYEVPK